MIIPRPRSVFISPVDDPDMTPSGLLYVPEQAKERTDNGIVKYVGSGVKFVSVGDWVLFSGYAGTLVFLEGEGRMISMDERDIQCICGPKEWASTAIAGLYYRDRNGEYFEATYESALELLKEKAHSFTSNYIEQTRKNKIDYRPSDEEIERTTNWPDHINTEDDD